jgi:hypothetical protein
MTISNNNTKVLNLIRAQIKNVVRKYVEKLKPINTQLFKINIDNID